MIYKILFFVCNIIFLFQNHYITNKTLSSIVAMLSVAGIIFSLQQSHIKTLHKFVISVIYVVALIIYLIFTYIQ